MTSMKNEKGQATLILVLAMGLVLVGGMGLAIDGARLYNQMQMAQVAADATATSSAMSIFQGNNVHSPAQATDFPMSGTITCGTGDTQLPCQYARKNGFGSDTSVDTVTIDFPTCTASPGSPGGSCGYAGTLASSLPAGVPSQVRVTISRNVSNGIIRMLGMGALTRVSTSATAAIVQIQSPTPLIVTDPNNTDSLSVVGGGSNDNITICGGPIQAIQVNSKHANAYDPPSSGWINLSHGGKLDSGQCDTGTGSSFGITGGPYATGGGTVNRVELGTTGQYYHHAPIADPYEDVSNPGEPGLPNAPFQVDKNTTPNNYGCTRTAAQGGCWVFSPGKYGACGGCTPFTFRSGGPGPNWPARIGSVDYIIFQPGLYYVKGGGVSFQNVHGGTTGSYNELTGLVDTTTPMPNSTACVGCSSNANTGQGITIFNTGDGNHNSDIFDIGSLANVAFQGPTITQVINGETVPGPPYYGLTLWNDNQSTNFQVHNMGQGNGCFTVVGTTYITPTLAIMQANSSQSSYQVAYYHGTPCSATATKGDIVVSDLKLDGTAAIKMNLVPFGFLYIYQVALVAGGVHP